MRQIGLLLGLIAGFLVTCSALADDPSVATMPPVVVTTVPQSGDTAVDPSLTEIRVTFSKNMQDGSWSWSQISDETSPQTTGKPHYLPDRQTCVLPVQLQPNRSYVTWLNSAKSGNFRDTDGRSAVPYLLVFETGTGRGPERDTASRIDPARAPSDPSSVVIERPEKHGKIPANARLISRVGESTEDKRSLGGSGHAVAFQRPSGASSVVAVQIFASRYGYPQPPDEDFHVYLLDQDRKVIKDLDYPYSTVERTREMRWYALPVPTVDVPENFYVALSFNPHRTKGIYLGYDQKAKDADSYVGLPDRGFEKAAGYDWMVRVYLAPKQGAPVEPDKDALLPSRVLRGAFSQLLSDGAVARRKAGGGMPAGWNTPQFVATIIERLEEKVPNVFQVTAEQETRFAKGDFDDAAATQRITKTLKVLEQFEAELPWMCEFIVQQHRAGKLKGAKLEVGSRVMQVPLAEITKELQNGSPDPEPAVAEE